METEIVCGAGGGGLLFLGGILWWLRRSGLVQCSIDMRKPLIEECKRTGDEQRAQRLTHEIGVFERRLPMYSRLLVIAGLLLMALSLVLHFTR